MASHGLRTRSMILDAGNGVIPLRSGKCVLTSGVLVVVIIPSPTMLCFSASSLDSVLSGRVSLPVTRHDISSNKDRSKLFPLRGYDANSVTPLLELLFSKWSKFR